MGNALRTLRGLEIEQFATILNPQLTDVEGNNAFFNNLSIGKALDINGTPVVVPPPPPTLPFLENHLTANVSIAFSTWTTGPSISLPAGIWYVVFNFTIQAVAAGYYDVAARAGANDVGMCEIQTLAANEVIGGSVSGIITGPITIGGQCWTTTSGANFIASPQSVSPRACRMWAMQIG